MDSDKQSTPSTGEVVMSEPVPSNPLDQTSAQTSLADPQTGDSTVSHVSSTVATSFDVASMANHLLSDPTKDILKDSNGTGQDLTLPSSDIAAGPGPSALSSVPLDTSTIHLSDTSVLPSIPPAIASIATPDTIVKNDASASLVAMAMGEPSVVTETTTGVSSRNSKDMEATAPVETGLQGAQSATTDAPLESEDTAAQSFETFRSMPTAVPWQDIMINMLSELGFAESSRMMAAEELVLSTTQRGSAPGIIAKFSKLLQESVSGSGSLSKTMDDIAGIGKRHNTTFVDDGSKSLDGQDAIKRRRVDDVHGRIQENATRDEIADRMAQFMATKREQINESNRQEFVKDRAVPGISAEDGSIDSSRTDDDGCARVDARKLNRTIQMKLETVKNEALTKTNPKSHAQTKDTAAYNGLDERLKNIQVHLNLRLTAVPACTVAERIRIIEDVIIQLERDYPLWSALHFNQPNRMFPPPPSVTTVSRNARNEIIMTGEHLHTTLIEKGDPVAHPALAQYPSVGMARSVSGNQAGLVDINSRPGVISGNTAVSDAHGPIGGGAARSGIAPSAGAGAGGSATVIKLKRHGGAGSSSLARAVQQQLAQRKANAASGGYTIDESKNTFAAHNNGSVPSFKIAPNPHRSTPSDIGSSATKSGAGSVHVSSGGSSPAGSFSPMAGFSDPLKPGVTGRGPIKSRRKSIAKGLEPTSAHTGNILGTHPGGGGVIMSMNNQSSSISESHAGSKPKPATAKKPRKKKGDDNIDDPSAAKPSRAGAGRGKGGFGLGKGGGRPAMGLGLGKGKGGAYRQELLRRAEVEEFEDESDEDDGDAFQPSNVTSGTLGRAGAGNGGSGAFTNDNSPLAQLVSSALKDHADSVALAQQKAQQQHQQLQQQQQQPEAKSKKQPRKQATAKPPPVRKFGGKSFGMAGGESSGSSSNESTDGEGSSGSQSDSSSSGISGSDGADSD
ncbi:hypothetical protein BGX28_004179 [Mortierella sp. GBA30]|nr:hypothetical protein BGX28_004179 [Mortierella sp. GBA30]